MDIQKIRSTFEGKVIVPGDADYDKARQIFYGGMDNKPEVIIRVANAADIQKAITLAKEHKLELRVRSGGHSIAGYSAAQGGLVVDVRDMQKLQIDDANKTAWAETGLTAKALTDELDKHNFVVGFGDSGSVGIGGITLGGGIGFLVRKFGMAIDNVLAAEIVTADGQVLEVDANNHPDLFWALRGGGGNFGVVTKFKYKLHDLGDCYGGMLFLPATPEVITGIIDIATKAPNELSMIVNIMPAFPMPMIPKEFHGKMSVMAMIMYAGDPTQGEAVVAPIKALAKPYADMTKPMRYKDMFPPEDESYRPTAMSYNLHLQKVDTKTANLALDWLNKVEAPMKALQLRVLGGAMADVAPDATAYAHRQQKLMANIAVFYKDDADKPQKQQWIHDFAATIAQGDDAAYVGFLGQHEEDRMLAVYPKATLERLKEVKRQYDPTNFFRQNYNIQP